MVKVVGAEMAGGFLQLLLEGGLIVNTEAAAEKHVKKGDDVTVEETSMGDLFQGTLLVPDRRTFYCWHH